MKTHQELYYELSYYTLRQPDPLFIHQHIVDAFAAQEANKDTKPITITFALIGLYLHLEKNLTGKEVQQAHMQIAQRKRVWPIFDLPKQRGDISVYDVMAAPEGRDRDIMIEKWCSTVWDAYKASHGQVRDITKSLLYSS